MLLIAGGIVRAVWALRAESFGKGEKRPLGWHVDLSDLLLDGPMDVWMGTMRMTGTGTVAAGLDFVIRGLLELPSTRFDLADGTISQGSELLVEGLDISTNLSLGPYRPKEVRGTDVFDHLLGSVWLEGGVIPEVANPPGYSGEPALAFGELTLELDRASGAVALARAAAPEIRVETQGETNNVEQLLASPSSGEPAQDAAEGSSCWMGVLRAAYQMKS